MNILDKIKKFIFVPDEQDETSNEAEPERREIEEKKPERESFSHRSEPLSEPVPELRHYDEYDGFKQSTVKNELLTLKETYVHSKSKADFVEVLKCLKTAKVLVPVVSGEKMHADTMTDAKGEKLLPVFSSKDQINFDYVNKFTMMEMPFVKCVALAHVMDGVKGIVLDAFTDSMVISFDMADGVVKMAQK